ncbi:MAG: alpha/beta fold hydrolase [Devosia sp.]
MLAQHHYRAADGTPLSYRQAGPAGGQAVVLCHGLAAGGSQFEADAAHFASLGFAVLVPDLRGHGESGTPPSRSPDDFAIRTLADDIASMLDHAGVAQVHWVGNSLGGIVALDLIGRQPQRFDSLALFGTAFALNLPVVLVPLMPMLYRWLGRDLLARITAVNTTRHKPARPLIAAMARAFDPQVGAALIAHLRRYDLHANALAYAGPVLVLPGGRDGAVNLALRPALKRIMPRPNWTVVELPQAGHCANLDATDAWRAALLAFWTAGVSAPALQ